MNDIENVWTRIVKNSGKIELKTIRGQCLKYKIDGNIVHWIGLEPTMNNLFHQSKENIIACFDARRKGLTPSMYPGTAPSYKWALLNHPMIWIE